MARYVLTQPRSTRCGRGRRRALRSDDSFTSAQRARRVSGRRLPAAAAGARTGWLSARQTLSDKG